MSRPVKRAKYSEVTSSALPPSLTSNAPLPRFIDIDSFLQARQFELNHFLGVLDDKSKLMGKTKHAFQLLPKHMRRRAMSHNTYRVPARVRVRQESEAQAKRSCRKRRRRASQLLTAYARRNQTSTWLETHIWHAKRMHMSSLWGYKLSVKPHEKGQRACYRFANADCTLYDASYYVTFKITADFEAFRQKFTREIRIPTDVLQGISMWDVLLFNENQLIAPVSLLSLQNTGKLLLFIHPAAYIEAKNLISDSFSLEDLKDQVTFYRLRGPNSLQILTDTLNIVNSSIRELLTSASQFNSYQFPSNSVIGFNYIPLKPTGPMHKSRQLERKSEGNWLPIAPEKALLETLINWPKDFSYSELWEKLREKQVKSLVPEKVTTRSRRCRFPKPVKVTSQEEKKPVKMTEEESDSDGEKEAETLSGVLVYRHSGMKRGLGSGWDLLLPSGQGITLWKQLVYAGGKVTGLREYESLLLEQGMLNFPSDYPTTRAYNELKEMQAEEMRAKYDRTPSAHKVNSEKIGFPTPFTPPWKLISPEQVGWEGLVAVRLKAIRRRPAPNSLLCLPLPCDLEGASHQESLHTPTLRSSESSSKQVETACLRISTDREIIGVVTSGGFSHARGRGYGVGFVVKERWNEELMLLFRRPQSRFYHLAEVKRLGE